MSRNRKDELSDLRALIAKAVPRKEVYERMESQRVTGDWQAIVGEVLALKSSPEAFDHGQLTISVTSAPWAQELRLRKQELLKRLNETAGRELFTDLKISVKAPKPRPQESPKRKPFEAIDAGVTITNPDLPEVVERVLGRLRSAAKRSKK